MDLTSQLVRDEGLRLKPYRDTVGKLTIGVGRNLSDVGISRDEALLLLANDISRAESELAEHLPWTSKLDDARLGVLIAMAFNLGIGGLLAFKDALGHIKTAEYDLAAKALLQSKWAVQVGGRAERLAEQLRTGQWQ